MTDKPGGIGHIGTNTVARVGYGTMQLFEPAPDDAAAVLRRAVELGVNHIDTASFYGPGEVNRRIKAALSPYRDDLVIVSKVGASHDAGGPIPLGPCPGRRRSDRTGDWTFASRLQYGGAGPWCGHCEMEAAPDSFRQPAEYSSEQPGNPGVHSPSNGPGQPSLDTRPA